MNVLIIYCHPGTKSYTSQALEYLKRELIAEGHLFEISDLYAMNFQSDMNEQEYEREGFSRIELPIPNDVQSEHQKIEWADCIIFLYPVWWSDCPAKLKGWFDRVYSVGYAYKQTGDLPKMKKIKYGVALCTAGYTNDFLEETGIARSMQLIMLTDRLGNRFEEKEMIILGGTLNINSIKHKHQTQIKNLVTKIRIYCA